MLSPPQFHQLSPRPPGGTREAGATTTVLLSSTVEEPTGSKSRLLAPFWVAVSVASHSMPIAPIGSTQGGQPGTKSIGIRIRVTSTDSSETHP